MVRLKSKCGAFYPDSQNAPRTPNMDAITRQLEQAITQCEIQIEQALARKDRDAYISYVTQLQHLRTKLANYKEGKYLTFGK